MTVRVGDTVSWLTGLETVSGLWVAYQMWGVVAHTFADGTFEAVHLHSGWEFELTAERVHTIIRKR